MNKHFFAWWNLENLFDVEGSPDRPNCLPKKKGVILWNKKI